MKKSYLIVGIMTVLFAVTSAASAIEYEVVGGYANCVGLEQATQSTGVALTPGETYTVTVAGNARANPAPGGDFDGVFCFFYDNGRPDHPVVKYLNKGDSFDFVASSINFFAFLADKSLKDIPDNSGSMTVTLTAPGREREELIVDAVFNCIGLEEFAAKKKILIPGESYVVTVTGNAYTNGTQDGYYDGVLLFTREAADPIHPIQLHLEIGEEFAISEMHATGWIYCWLVDESYGTMGNNGGKMTVAFEGSPGCGIEWQEEIIAVSGDSVQMCGPDGPYSYSWTGPGGLISPERCLILESVSEGDSGVYDLEVFVPAYPDFLVSYCSTNLVVEITPAEDKTWGSIKALYR